MDLANLDLCERAGEERVRFAGERSESSSKDIRKSRGATLDTTITSEMPSQPAVRFHKGGQWVSAGAAYRCVLAVAPRVCESDRIVRIPTKMLTASSHTASPMTEGSSRCQPMTSDLYILW